MGVCQTCGAQLAPPEGVADSIHEQWHRNIATVAIESTKRIEQLERRVQELEAGYGDQ